MSGKSVLKVVTILVVASTLLYWDISQADKGILSQYKSFKLLSELDGVSEATTKVSIVRSDDTELPNPTPITNENITYEQIEDMVRRAIELAGGFDWVIQPGNMVLLKPNIVDPEPPGSGEITDVRVIKALIKIIDEIDPGNMQIVVGEGSPREMDYELPYSKRTSPRWEKLWDVAGYQDLLIDPYLTGINFRLSNLNGSPPEDPWQDLVEVDVPDGGQADPQSGKYYIHKDILNADVYITVPVMKIHNPGITVSLKNQIGLAPSTRYGFSKNAGVPQDGYQHRLHTPATHKYWTDKEIVDLSNLAQIKYVVVDALACLEREKGARRSGNVITNLVRMNSIIAGVDPVAVDHVCCRLMGLNPHDIGHVTLAERVGLGTNNEDNIHIVGADLETTAKRFIKSQDSAGNYGETNRVWLLNGPYSIDGISDPMNHAFITNEATVKPKAALNGWSEPIYFIDDYIDLYNYYNLSYGDNAISYAFTYFDAPKDQEAELWIGSDESIKVFINGNEVYVYDGTRSFNDYYSVRVNAPVKAGENTLLIKALQKVSRYEFSINICEPETDPDFDGNRIWGLTFKTESSDPSAVSDNGLAIPNAMKLYNNYPNPFNNSTQIHFDLDKTLDVNITIFDMNGREIKQLYSGLTSAGEHEVSWNGRDQAGKLVASGMYVYKLTSAEQNFSHKMLLIK